MSLHPKKKSDMGKAWMQKRPDRFKKIHPEYHLIVTEGTKTEPKYFEAMKNLINSKYGGRIQLKIFGEGENTISLFETAKARAENDPNQCIELWFLLHFDYLQSDIAREAYYPKLNQRLKRMGMGDYKKNRADMFSILLPYLDTAISNAKNLYEVKKQLTPSNAAPCTTVFELLEFLLPYIKDES